MLASIMVPIVQAIMKEGGKKAIPIATMLGAGCLAFMFYKERNLHEEAMNDKRR